jgi:hypothetical protein
MKTISSPIVVLLALGFSAIGDDAAAKRKAEAVERKAVSAERKAKAVRDAEVKSLKQEVRVLQSQKTSTAREYGEKSAAIRAKQDVIRAKERQ